MRSRSTVLEVLCYSVAPGGKEDPLEPTTRFDEIKLPLREPVHGFSELSAVMGIPEWWPTGSRVAVVLAHGSTGSMNDPLLEYLHTHLTEHKYLTLRFNFPFAEAGKRASADNAKVLEQALRAAVGVLGRDPTAAPAHLFLGGMGLGARTVSELASKGIRLDGLFYLGYPLHSQDKPEKINAEHLFRVISPMLFLQGTRDRTCDIDALRRTLTGVGAPTGLHLVEDADRDFKVTKRSGLEEHQVHAHLLAALLGWMEQTLASAD